MAWGLNSMRIYRVEDFINQKTKVWKKKNQWPGINIRIRQNVRDHFIIVLEIDTKTK